MLLNFKNILTSATKNVKKRKKKGSSIFLTLKYVQSVTKQVGFIIEN
jgi:hypothetical protein